MKKFRDLFKKNNDGNSTNNVESANRNPKEDESKKTEQVNRNPKEDESKKTESGEASSESVKTGDKSEKSGKSGKAKIHNLIIVDESGSMSSLRTSTLSGINEIINTIKGAQKQYGATQTQTLTLVTFDTGNLRKDIRTLIDDAPIDSVGEFDDYSPFGGTPLYDAMGISINNLYQKIRDDEDATGVVTILTDGYENSSKEWTLSGVSSLIEQLKGEGWSFSYMGSCHDVKQVSLNLHIENVIEFSHDDKGTSYTWQQESGSREAYYRKMERMYREKNNASKEEKIRMKRQFADEYYGNRVSPSHIDRLNPGEIFVFGSDPEGHHKGGAARQAVMQFGAHQGQGEGIQGMSYAIPTTGSRDEFQQAIQRFCQYAHSHPEMKFLLTRVGCGSAGYTIDEAAEMFSYCVKLENVSLPAEFWKSLGLTQFIR